MASRILQSRCCSSRLAPNRVGKVGRQFTAYSLAVQPRSEFASHSLRRSERSSRRRRYGAQLPIEPWVGGRVFERAADGHETAWGTVLAYDPPHRLTFFWIVELPAGQEQLVEIRFTPEDRGTTVELTHSGWEQLGDATASLRERYDWGWGAVPLAFRQVGTATVVRQRFFGIFWFRACARRQVGREPRQN